jgi:hypothetical protein
MLSNGDWAMRALGPTIATAMTRLLGAIALFILAFGTLFWWLGG